MTKKTSPKTKNKKDNSSTNSTEKTSLQNSTNAAETIGNGKDNIRFIIGVFLCLLAIFTLLSMVSFLFTGAQDQKLLNNPEFKVNNWMGQLGANVSQFMITELFGIPSMLIPVFVMVTGICIMKINKIRLHKWFINCTILMCWSSLFLAYLQTGIFNEHPTHIRWGGYLGFYQHQLLAQKVGNLGMLMILLFTALCYLAYVSERTVYRIRKACTKKVVEPELSEDEEAQNTVAYEANLPAITDVENTELPEISQEITQTKEEEVSSEVYEDDPNESATTIEFNCPTTPTNNKEAQNQEVEMIIEQNNQEEQADDETTEGEQASETENATEQGKDVNMTVIEGKGPKPADVSEYEALEPFDPKLDLSHYKYPTLSLLTKYDETGNLVDMEEQNKNKEQIINVLNYYGVSITSIKATVGPTITLYEVTPELGIRISKIKNLEAEIALNLRALGIRIIAPIPGKGTIGIEVPNAKPQMVSMESILNSQKFKNTDYELPLALGKTITNEVFMVDLTKMPHLLVAGATGMGKSVGLNAIITSLLYKKHPAELKLVMIDPKKVEFSIYSPIINHFLAQVEGNEDDEPIITDVSKVVQTLKSLCIEMDSRYDLLKRARCRNIKEYNQQFKNRRLNPENGHRYMPYIVVIIDEFGDLIMTAGKEIELPIARIAQLARAVGIHMIIATQRPTTTIITGTIKANFPARMAFKVSAMVDSRTIIDRPGANQLVGKGDMLFLSGNEPIRVQCAFVDTPEVENICTHIAKQQSYLGPHLLPEVEMEGGDDGKQDVDINHLDPMFEEVARMVVQEQIGSTSMIQRKFSIGYNRAGRIMDQLEKMGFVGVAKGSKPREVLCISEDELQNRLANMR